MIIKTRVLELFNFLNNFSSIHKKEMIVRDLRDIPTEYLDWANQIKQLSFNQRADLESYFKIPCNIDYSFKDYLKEIKYLTNIPIKTVNKLKLDQTLLRKLSLKKSHEIQKLTSLIHDNIKTDTFIDIGSGAGHLSNSLVFDRNYSSYCIDLDAKFQEIGKQKINRWIPSNLEKINFINIDFKSDSINRYLSYEACIIGLHSCGDLSNLIIKSFVESKNHTLINFGCCYYKLKVDSFLCEFLEDKTSLLSKESLFLAERTSPFVAEQDISTRYKVKKYRYAYHLLLKKLKGHSFDSLGNSSMSLYNKSFDTYFFSNYSGDIELTPEIVNDFFYSKQFESDFETYFALDSIRFLLGRVIETLIVLDRVQYLLENNVKAEVFTLFDPKISPRNLCIFAKK